MGQPRRALVFSGGAWVPSRDSSIRLAGPWTWVVCADSGARHALALGYEPDVLVGDLDSIAPDDAKKLGHIPTYRFPAAKDKTDTDLAIEWVLSQGADDIVIAGGLGTRFDHSLANVHLLVKIHEKGARGIVTDGCHSVYLLTDRMDLHEPAGTVLTILPVTPELKGLTIRGLRWELDGAQFQLGETLGVSNEFTGRMAELTLKEGLALVIVSNEDGL